jgi:hypothetical protein
MQETETPSRHSSTYLRIHQEEKGELSRPYVIGTAIQVLGITTDTEVEGDKEGDSTTTVATDSSLFTPADTVFLCNGNCAATPSDLFDTVKRNIRLGSTTYTCSYVTVSKGKPTRKITKVYCCSKVITSQGWVSKPSYREPKFWTILLGKGRCPSSWPSKVFHSSSSHLCHRTRTNTSRQWLREVRRSFLRMSNCMPATN